MIKIAQEILQAAGYYKGTIDGDFGSKSRDAAKKYFKFPREWENERIAIGVIQVFAIRSGVDPGIIDGRWGRNTEAAYKKILPMLGKKVSTPTISTVVNPSTKHNNWPRQNYRELVNYYGKVGTNQTSLTLPYKMVIAWDTSKKLGKITCHKKVADSLERILKNTLDHYGYDAIQELRLDMFGGCLNVRKMRGGSSWSMHSWGIAVDLDPARNRLKWGRDKAVFAQSEYMPFWEIVESEGWISLGRERNMDYMHFQAARL